MNRVLIQSRMTPATRVIRCNALFSLHQSRVTFLRSPVVTRSFSSISSCLLNTQAGLSSVGHVTLSDMDSGPIIPIRERLRTWEEVHKENLLQESLTSPFTVDIAAPGALDNSLTRPFEGIKLQDEEGDSLRMFGKDELVDLGDRRPFLLRGDMVDLVFHGGQKSELAIFVQDFETTSQFYTMSGQWVHRLPRSVMYYVPGFISADELAPLLPYLPKADVAEADKNTLHGFETALPRHIGAPIVNKMRAFWTKADAVYRSSAHRLDSAHSLLARKQSMSYCSINELAEIVLPDSVKRDEQGRLPETAVYAVYRVLSADDKAFRPSSASTHRITGLFEISSQSELNSIAQVSQMVRAYQEHILSGSEGKVGNDILKLKSFLDKSRAVIDRSRKGRQITKYGVVGPHLAGKTDSVDLVEEHDISWNALDMQIIMFLESWAGLRSFRASSIHNSIGSYLLRLVDRYPEHTLDMSTAWQFLQEVGSIAPWETRTPFDARLPRTGHRLQKTLEFPGFTEKTFTVNDAMLRHRHDWENMPVYCIDDVGAHEIDDGVSIEAIENSPNEHWVHIHTADPASIIKPDSALGSLASKIVGNIYMPDRVRSMLPHEVVMEHMSLAPNRRALTFSARMSDEGKILESKVTPSIVRNVKFISPDTVMTAIGRSPAVSTLKTIIQVGPNRDSSLKPRAMLKADDLTESDVQNLKLLDKYGEARASIYASNGDVAVQWPQPEISVQFPASSTGEPLPHEIIPETSPDVPIRSYKYDPSITLKCDRFDSKASNTGKSTVRNLMVIASEVVGQWCIERNIPIIYRATPQHPNRPDPAEFFRTVIKPAQDKDGNVPIHLRLQFLRLLGGARGTTTPAPHLALGMDFYTKVTSPLRRYGDLLAHWQIQAAIREEARTGTSLIGSTREDYLPFTKAQIEAMIPQLDAKDSQIATFNNDCERQWAINLLVRAWHFKEAKLPDAFDVFVLHVSSVNGSTLISGFMLDFGVRVQFEAPSFVAKEDIQLGDIFECEIENLQSYNQRVIMKALTKKKSVGQDGYNP